MSGYIFSADENNLNSWLINTLDNQESQLQDPDCKIHTGGARRDRTDDLLLAKQALSQLSYGPGCERYAP